MSDRVVSSGRRVLNLWPWAVLLLSTVPAFAHFVTFEHDLDGEYPKVLRPTFNAHPPAAYRLAEPGDTIDRIGLYASAAVVAVAGFGWIASRRARLWPAAMALGLAAGWFAATPGPCYDGWHGLGWRAIGDGSAPLALRATLVGAALGLLGVVVGSMVRLWPERPELLRIGRRRRAVGLLVAAVVLVTLRSFDIPGTDLTGYWPRWSFAWGIMAFGFALLHLLPGLRRGALWLGLGAATACGLMIFGGIRMFWLHRPLERLRAVVPGKIYISAMPSYRGLAIEQERLHFKTIVNLFPEETAQRSPRLPEEMRFVRERGLKYVGSPGTALESDTFLDETLAIARDPSAWPILVHCHGCMDRSPAWMGIYRFLDQGVPLDQALKEIERHRGCRPKASVTLLYNRVLPPAPRNVTNPTRRRGS